MALPIGKILLAVPWGKVISNAPLLVDQAQQLWASSSRRKVSRNAEGADEGGSVEHRVALLEQANADLQAQLAETSALIVQLTEQNAGLIRRIERDRRLGYAAVVLSLIALAGVIWMAAG